MVIDSYENIYVSNFYANAVRKINKSNGIFTTIAGVLNFSRSSTRSGIAATSAQLTYPAALAFSNSCNLYIADSGSHTNRKVSASTGQIITVVGTLNSSGNSVDGGNTSIL